MLLRYDKEVPFRWITLLLSRLMSTHNLFALQENDSGTLDTVGAVVVDHEGNVAAAVSSGGLALKHPGRVGQVSSYGVLKLTSKYSNFLVTFFVFGAILRNESKAFTLKYISNPLIVNIILILRLAFGKLLSGFG